MIADYPKSLTGFQKRFPDKDACIALLFDQVWPDGFEYPACGHRECCALKSEK